MNRSSLTLVGGLNALLRRWGIVAGLPVSGALLAVLASLAVRPMYTATTTFVPEARANRPATDMTGAAGLSASEPSLSPQFYADVVRSRELLERVLLAHYAAPRRGGEVADSAALLEILGVGGRDRPDSLARGVKRLGRLISVGADYQTNIVRLSVDAASPGLAADVANRLVQYLNEFNTRKRQSQARERRKFTEERIAATDSELRQAEHAVKTFYERNRTWQQSPELVFEEARLRRQVDVSQEVYLTLRRENETARIEEVNDAPVITVIDPAVPPVRRSKPRRALLAALGFSLGAMAAVFWAFAADYADRLRRDDDHEYRELRSQLRRLAGDLRRSASRIRRVGP